MNKPIIVDVGTLSSLGMLYYNIGPKLSELRNITKHEDPIVIWDFTFIEQKRMSMSALTAFLAIAKSISKYYEKPMLLKLRWDPYTLHFLSDISFFNICQELEILNWQDEMIGGFSEKDSLKTNTKIIYFNDIPEISYENENEVSKWKEKNREYIRNSFLVNFTEIFSDTIFTDDWNNNLKYKLSEITSELAVNSLLHGNETAFIGVQKSSKGISVSVCDAGIGFLESMKKTNKWIVKLGVDKNVEALLYATLIKEYEIGLKSVIEDVLESDGWVTMSSYDCVIRWEKNNWKKACSIFNKNTYMTKRLDVKDMLGEPLRELVSMSQFRKGNYKLYKNYIKGVRITFEIPFK